MAGQDVGHGVPSPRAARGDELRGGVSRSIGGPLHHTQHPTPWEPGRCLSVSMTSPFSL